MSDTLVQIVSVFIAGVSALISAFFAFRARRDTQIAQQAQLMALKRQYYSELQRWADQVVDVLTAAIFLCKLQDSNKTHDGDVDVFYKWFSIREKLSSLIDQGRFFIPNEEINIHGQSKPLAYRGFRPRHRNLLVESYDTLGKFDKESLNRNGDLHNQLWEKRKDFVSELQKILDPYGREKEMNELQKGIKH